MRSGARTLTVIGVLCGVISAIAATHEIVDFWQRRASAPSGNSESRPQVEGGRPEAAVEAVERANDSGSLVPLRESSVRPETATREPARQDREPASLEAESLINGRAIPPGSVPVMAIALEGDPADAELLEAALAQEVSSAEMRLVPDLFKPAFRERGYLRAAYDGDTDVLTHSGALAAVDWILVGRVERTCRETGQIDSDLVTCDVRLSFKVIDRHGSVVNAGHVAMPGAGFSQDTARDRAIEMLVQRHGKRVASSEQEGS